MVSLGFSVFMDEIINGIIQYDRENNIYNIDKYNDGKGVKRQTIRLDSKKWKWVLIHLANNERVFLELFWHMRRMDCYLLGVVTLKNIYPKLLTDISKTEAINDGFNSVDDLRKWFYKTYPKYNFKRRAVYIIQW